MQQRAPYSSSMLAYRSATWELKTWHKALETNFNISGPMCLVICSLASFGSATVEQIAAETSLEPTEVRGLIAGDLKFNAYGRNPITERAPGVHEVYQLSDHGEELHAKISAAKISIR